jgi:hypothetical protein
MRGCCALFVALVLAGCGPAQGIDAFGAEIAADHPPGSPEAALREGLVARGFVEGRPFGPPVDLPVCYRRSVSYGLMVGGDRYVCFEATPDGILSEVLPAEFVMSP